MTAWYHAGLRHAARPRLALAAALLTGCGAGVSPGYLPGASDASRGGGAGPAPAAAGQPAKRWAQFEAARKWPPVDSTPVAAKDHGGGRYLGIVRVSPEARQDYLDLSRGTKLPVGSVVAMFHEQARGHAPGPVYVMKKAAGGWRYLVVGPGGRIRSKGALPLCERCHVEARSDHLFGRPIDAETHPQPPPETRPDPESTQVPKR